MLIDVKTGKLLIYFVLEIMVIQFPLLVLLILLQSVSEGFV